MRYAVLIAPTALLLLLYSGVRDSALRAYSQTLREPSCDCAELVERNVRLMGENSRLREEIKAMRNGVCR